MPIGLGASNQTSIGCNIRQLLPVVNISLGANVQINGEKVSRKKTVRFRDGARPWDQRTLKIC